MKVRVKTGNVEIDYEGSEAFFAKKVPEFVNALSHVDDTAHRIANARKPALGGADRSTDNGTLAAFLREKSAKASQVKKFLATAVWLQNKGSARLTTSQVAKALSTNNQGKLSNPSDCLAKNMSKGHCEKDGKEFFVTDEGRESL